MDETLPFDADFDEFEAKDQGQQLDVAQKIQLFCLEFLSQLRNNSGDENVVVRLTMNSPKAIRFNARFSAQCSFVMRALAQIQRLILHDQYATKRDLFYEQKLLYGVQRNFDSALTTICALLEEPRRRLHVLSTAKGMIMGDLVFATENGHSIDCRITPTILMEQWLPLSRIESSARFILVVEKDATFQKLIDERFLERFKASILVTGKGYPDLCTRKFLQNLHETLRIPMLCLVDNDPHGLEIVLTYKYGSACLNRLEKAVVSDISWLGLTRIDTTMMPITDDQYLPMKPEELAKIDRLKERAESLNEDLVAAELNDMRNFRTKLELEAVSGLAPGYLVETYLEQKLSRLYFSL